MSKREKNPIHSFRRSSEKSHALRQEATEAGLSAFDGISADKSKRPHRRHSEKPQSDESTAEAVSTEEPRVSGEPWRKPQGERVEDEKSAASGKTMEKVEQKEEHAPRRNPRKKVPAGQLAKFLKHVKFPKAHSVHLDPKAKVKVIPPGGLEQIDMNIMAFECNDTVIAVDCGITFPGEDMLGIDCVIPDVSYLKENRGRIKGFVIMHGYEDHIDALPYILKELNVLAYSTKPIIALIRHKLEEYRLLDSAKLSVVKYGDTVPFGGFNVEFIKTDRSTSDGSALVISSPVGIIFHASNFKIDCTPVSGEVADLQHMVKLDKYGVFAIPCSSTNTIRPDFTMSEKTVGRTFDLIFVEHQKNRIITATFMSNVDRVQQVISSAHRYGREVVVEGKLMVDVIGIVNRLGYIEIPGGTLIEIDQLKNYPPKKTVLITTGPQGESMATLPRMAGGMHRKAAISPNDVVIINSHPIPGNEKAVDRVINELSIRGADVIF